MKAIEQTASSGNGKAQKPPAGSTIREYVGSMKEGLFLAAESFNEDIDMPKSTLLTFKVGLLLQYIGIAFVLLKSASLTGLANGEINCRGQDGRTINGSESLILNSLCRNAAYQDRYSTLFICLEIPVLGILLLKLLLDERNFGWKANRSIHLRIEDETMYYVTMLPRVLVYLLLPIHSAMSTTAVTLGTFNSIIRSPILFLLMLPIRIIVYPIAMFFPYLIHNYAEIDFGKMGRVIKDVDSQMEFINITGKINCFESCTANFESSWCFSVCFLLINYTVVYWIFNIPGGREESRRGESRENYSDGVEFIRISEVSEDFSYEEDEGRVSTTNESDTTKSSAIELDPVKSDTTETELSESCTDRSDSIQSYSNVSRRIQLFEHISDANVTAVVDLTDKETPVSDAKESDVTDQRRRISVAQQTDEVSKPELIKCDAGDVQKETKTMQESAPSNKYTQTSTQNANKGCQTFVPIHLHKKINKKTQVSPFTVNAQTNTEPVTINETVSSVPRKDYETMNGHHGRFQITKNSDLDKNDEAVDDIAINRQEHALSGLENGESNLDVEKGKDIQINRVEELPKGETPTLENGHEMCNESDKKFGYAELSLIPGTLDFERKTVRKNQIRRINVDTFLKHLKLEEDRDVIFVEKDLLLNTFRDFMTILKITETEEAVCPKTDELLQKCDCSVHKLIRSLPKEAGQPLDEFDGLKMETEDDYCSDDESFFNGFRL